MTLDGGHGTTSKGAVTGLLGGCEGLSNGPSCLHRGLSVGSPCLVRHASGQSPVRADDNTISDTITLRAVVGNVTGDVCDNEPRVRVGPDYPFTENELKDRYGVEFIRTPHNERLVFENASYLDVHDIQNQKFGYGYLAHVWRVDFLAVGVLDFKQPMPGLLQITVKRWRHARLGDARTVFQGTCAVVANDARQIVGIQVQMGEDA